MELATTLRGETVQTAVRKVGINPNHWYPLEWSDQLKPGQLQAAVVWQRSIVVYRDQDGHAYVLENRCPHRGVELHLGKVQGKGVACAYHGWVFDGESGDCTDIPYLPSDQKLPCASVQSYPVKEKYGLIWVFPGDPALADDHSLPEVPEFESDEWLMIPITANFKAHFSICNENAMDVFHGFLHQELQGWFNPILLDLKATDESIYARYNVSYKGRLANFLGLSESATEVTTLPISINYIYPHYASQLEGVSSVYLMRLPVDLTKSRSFALFFFKVRLPQWFLTPLKPLIQKMIRTFMLQPFLNQDIEMMESEQEKYLAEPDRRFMEINPAIIALQRLIVRQYVQYVQQSSLSSEVVSGAQSAVVISETSPDSPSEAYVQHESEAIV
ncbi:MAG: aromatic ring-hydroxylating dioxygenase subunit alpha [Cyanobacteria bacterium P01_A01_bin.37]